MKRCRLCQRHGLKRPATSSKIERTKPSTTKPNIVLSFERASENLSYVSVGKLMPVSNSFSSLFSTHISTVWDSKPEEKGSPINWVELKTSAEIRNPGGMENFKRKLMKYWIQSFLLGVPRIVVGFRTQDGILVEAREMETHRIPDMVNADPNPKWNADMCVNFAATFLECKPTSQL